MAATATPTAACVLRKEILPRAELPADVCTQFVKKIEGLAAAPEKSTDSAERKLAAKIQARVGGGGGGEGDEGVDEDVIAGVTHAMTRFQQSDDKVILSFALMPASKLREVLKEWLRECDGGTAKLYDYMDRVRLVKLTALASVVGVDLEEMDDDDILTRGSKLRGPLTQADIVRILSP